MSARLPLPRLGDDPRSPFPPTATALDTPNGLLAWGGGLEPERLLAAYRRGIFPWYSDGQPLLWWSPAPRCVIRPQHVYVSRRTRRRFNSGRFELTLDRAFTDVVSGCASSRRDDEGTWITEELAGAFAALHRRGCAHSLEAWHNGELVGGIYGLALGRAFFGESMFARRTDASKIALVALCRLLARHGFELLDCQVENPHLLRMGAESWPRERFETVLARLVDEPVDAAFWRKPLPAERW